MEIPMLLDEKCIFLGKSFAVLKNSRIFAVPNEREIIIGVWRSWLAHLVWDQRVLCSSHSTPTKFQSNYLNFKWLLFSFGHILAYWWLLHMG